MNSCHPLLATSLRQHLLRFIGFADPYSVKPTIHDEILRRGVGCDPATVTHHLDFCSQSLQKLIDRGPFTGLRAVLATAPPCSDGYAVDWRGPQTQRRDFGLRQPRANRSYHSARQVQKFARGADWRFRVTRQITNSILPLRAVGVAASPRFLGGTP